ncbi:MAG TPA: DUF2917 domain-containing protein [Candidatus Saccharimonadia bacterium]|nr:DUF2917 domain-containing protein [Candidatus Saccharimonadia bacterium]
MKASALFDTGGIASRSSDLSASSTQTTVARPARKAPTVVLERGSVMSRPLQKGETLRVSVSIGHAWITMEGDARDYVLTAHDQHEFAGPGLLVIEGLEQGAWVQMVRA